MLQIWPPSRQERRTAVRPLNTEQALALLDAAKGEHLWPYVPMSVYRHQVRPVTRAAAIALGARFESRGKTNGGQN